jgi:AraC family transcriptional regulator
MIAAGRRKERKSLYEWYRKIQEMVGEIDRCIKSQNDEALTLVHLARKLGYSEFYVSRKFREISGMQLRDYLRYRKLAFALKELRDTENGILDIALQYGFSSHEAFTRAFKEAYGLTPSEYRLNPAPVVLRTVIKPFDCYLLGIGGTGMAKSSGEVKTYFVTIPAHKFLHIRNYESVGYWDFWQKQSLIPGQDCETICGLLDSIKGKLDDMGGEEADSSSGQLMAYINEPAGRICSWGIPLAEAYGVRLPVEYHGEIPPQMQLMEVAAGDYIVFEHGPFDYETENSLVEARIEEAMKSFSYAESGYRLDLSPGRVFYFYHDCKRFWKYVRPVKKAE